MATAQAAPAKDSGKKAAPVAMRPFFTGTLDLETRTKTYADTVPNSLSSLDTYYPKTNGFLADLWIDVTVTTSGNSANVAFNEDYPWNFLATVQLSDTGGQPILGPLTGWELKTFVKWGGFAFSDDPQESQTYSATTGTGGTGGSFSFILQLPVQFVRREPLGPLPNTNSNNAYALDISLAAESSVYSTPPTTNGTYSIKIYQDSYRQSAGKDAQGNATVTTPPGMGAVLYARRNTLEIGAGSFDTELSQQEGSYRALHFVLRDSNDSRTQGDSDWPSPAQVYLNNDVPYDRTKAYWIRRQERDYGYVAAVNTAGGRDYGTFTLPFITDHELKAGSEDRYKYLNVSAADTLGMRGSIGGSGTHKLTTIYNFVRPPGGNLRGLTAR